MFIKYGGKIIEIKNSILCKNYGKFLKEFVEKNNDLRKKGGLYKLLGKNNNNTLYGRLGMNPEKMEESIFFNEIKEKNFEKIIEVMGIKIGYSKSKIKTSNVMVAAAITSKARIKLYEGFKSVEENGGRILYCDTDSIIAAFKKDVYKDKLDKKFGEIIFDSNLSDTIIEDCVFCLPKTYALKFLDNEVVKIKGFNVKPNYRKFKYFFYNNIEIETKNKIFIKKNFQIEINEELIKKTNLRSLEKRKWSNDLKKSEPLKLN